MVCIRSCVFNLLFILLTAIHSILLVLLWPFSLNVRYQFARFYCWYIIKLAKLICGICYEVHGRENLTQEASIIFSNHQSTWETLAFPALLPLQTWVAKKELLSIPLFGWAFALLQPIAIDRKKHASAKDQLLQQGQKKLAEGRWVVIYPQGTRVEIGKTKAFTRGGALLAETTKKSVVPIAHNAGEFWSRQAFVKKPGTIKVIIGPAINTIDKTASEINQEAEEWINRQVKSMISSRHTNL